MTSTIRPPTPSSTAFATSEADKPCSNSPSRSSPHASCACSRPPSRSSSVSPSWPAPSCSPRRSAPRSIRRSPRPTKASMPTSGLRRRSTSVTANPARDSTPNSHDTVASVDGVDEVALRINGYAQLVGRDGQPVGDVTKSPAFGTNWVAVDDLNPYKLASGHAPNDRRRDRHRQGERRQGRLRAGRCRDRAHQGRAPAVHDRRYRQVRFGRLPGRSNGRALHRRDRRRAVGDSRAGRRDRRHGRSRRVAGRRHRGRPGSGR